MKRINVIEDEIHIKQSIESKLTKNGYEITTQNPDLYIFDLGVDGKPRWDRLEALRANTNALIIVLTAYPPSFEKKARELGADGFLNKPIVPDDLINYINEKLNYETI